MIDLGESIVYLNVSSSDPCPLTMTPWSSLSRVTAASADTIHRYRTGRYRIYIFIYFVLVLVKASKVELFIAGSGSIPAEADAVLHIVLAEGLPVLWRRCVHGECSV